MGISAGVCLKATPAWLLMNTVFRVTVCHIEASVSHSGVWHVVYWGYFLKFLEWYIFRQSKYFIINLCFLNFKNFKEYSTSF